MIGLQLMFFSGIAASLSNLCMRKSIDGGGTTKSYLMMQLFLSSLVAVLLNPLRMGNFDLSFPTLVVGIMGGLLLSSFMGTMGLCLEYGPPGLSVALLNCSSVMPIFVLVLLFGANYGFIYTWWNALGSLLVVAGMMWAGLQAISMVDRRKWLFFVTLAFSLHVIYLVFLQWRALFFSFPESKLLGIHLTPKDMECQWFMPIAFLTAACMQALVFIKKEKRWPRTSEMKFAFGGGIANGLCAFFLIRSTEVATSFEQAMLFPLFSVTIILGCNTWGRWLYKENVNWRANACCIAGLFIGMIDWATLFSK